MKIDSKDVSAWISNLGAYPYTTKIAGAFAVPITLLLTSTKFAGAGKSAQVMHGIIGLSCLIYSLIIFLKKRDRGKDE